MPALAKQIGNAIGVIAVGIAVLLGGIVFLAYGIVKYQLEGVTNYGEKPKKDSSAEPNA